MPPTADNRPVDAPAADENSQTSPLDGRGAMAQSLPPSAIGSASAGRWLVVFAALLWSTSGFFVKAPIFADWHSGLKFAFWRALFAAMVLLPMVRRPRFTWKLIPMIVAFVAMNVTYLTAMTKTTAANAIWLQNTAPAWVFLASVLWLRERIRPRDWLLLLFGILGVGVILFYEVQGAQVEGVLWGLAGGLTYAGVVLSLRQMRDQDPAWLVGLNHLMAVLVLGPFVLWSHPLPSGEQFVYLAGFGALQMGLPYLLFARGLRTVSSHEAAGIVLLEPLLVPVWVWVAWRNHPSYVHPAWWTIVGGGLILTGLLIRYIGAVRIGRAQPAGGK